MKTAVILIAIALATGPAFGSSILLTADPHIGTTTTFTDTTSTVFAQATLDGFSVTGTFGWAGNETYYLESNGSWTQSWIGTDGTDSITFNLGGAFSSVGAFVNYAPGFGNDATITALGTDGTTVIGTYDLVTMAPISTPGALNAGAFRGILSTSDDIGYLQLGGDFIIANSIEVGDAPPSASPVPEPSSMFLLGTGALGLAGSIRRKLLG
jgi:PEP-CTERM motif